MLNILKLDPWLTPYKEDILLRRRRYEETRKRLLAPGQTLWDFANGHQYFGFHKTDAGWYYREWAPGAEEMYLTGDFCHWDMFAYPMKNLSGGVWELFLPGKDVLQHGQGVMAVVAHDGQILERIPLYARYVAQDLENHSFHAEIYEPATPFCWTDGDFRPQRPLFIYECHIGMAQEAGRVGTYREFRENILPRVKALGYNTIQLMAIQEHPYYASFGYQVTNFFAPSSRFGTPDDLKDLINTAHSMGIAVLLDVVHSHASKNTREGLNGFDGTEHQFFHAGLRGEHPAWNTKCFDYGKPEVLHFLLSNLKYWLTEFHFDGFRFDGVTSMLYRDHGLGTAFTDYGKYFSMNTDPEAVTYLSLATALVRQGKENAILIAEDMSAMPGLCLPIEDGGMGFDYRLAMGEPDLWVGLLEKVSDENWDLNQIYYELTTRRPGEKVIGYCESHDQALVGDKTILFRLCDSQMYWGMEKTSQNPVIDRGVALHKLLRLLTATLGSDGYLTFMGNEFGHPEWIDFPREGNGWSYHYCRRQWSLAENDALRYGQLKEFEIAIVKLCKQYGVMGGQDRQLWLDNGEKVLIYRKGSLVFAVNIHPEKSYDGYFVPVDTLGNYNVVMSTDEGRFGGFDRIPRRRYEAIDVDGKTGFRMYLPSRTAVVLQLTTDN